MNQKTLDLIHEKYQESLRKSSNILEIVKNLYNLSKDEEVDSADANEFYSFVDGLRACYRFRENTFASTNITTYITITVMYIIIWLNETYNLHLDINLYSRRKSLESELSKILRKSSETSSVNIRDRFGIRGVLLNSCNEIEIQLKSLEMHKQAEHGSASHDAYKKYLGDDGAEDPINKVFVVDDFSELNIIGFTSYESKENDQDGIHFAKEFSDRRISTTLVPKS